MKKVFNKAFCKSCFSEMKIVIACLLIMSFALACSTVNESSKSNMPRSYDEDGMELLGNFTSSLDFSGNISQIVAFGIDPFIALSVLSIAGNVMKSETLNLENSSYANQVTNLPIANIKAAIILTLIAIFKILLEQFRGSMIFSEALFEKIEYAIGIAVSCGIGFLSSSTAVTLAYTTEITEPIVTLVHATEIIEPLAENQGTATTIALTVFSFIISVLSYITFFVIRVMIKALDVATFLFSLIPIPGSFQIIQLLKYVIALLYTLLGVLAPNTAAALGLVIILVAFLIFKKASRLKKYFIKIYITPLLNKIRNKIFKRKELSLVMQKTPACIHRNFSNITLCQEAFVIKGVPNIPKRGMLYLVCANSETYLCRKRFLRKLNIIKFHTEELHFEKSLRYLIIFKKNETNKTILEIVLRSDLNKSFDEIKNICRFQ